MSSKKLFHGSLLSFGCLPIAVLNLNKKKESFLDGRAPVFTPQDIRPNLIHKQKKRITKDSMMLIGGSVHKSLNEEIAELLELKLAKTRFLNMILYLIDDTMI